jgi:hypothetical protein
LAFQRKAAAEESRRCDCAHPETGERCGSSDIVKSLYDDFGETVCEACKAQSPEDYTLINKSDSMSRYLMSDDTMQILKFTTKVNPRNHLFAPMKLYLLKHVRQKSYKRWGDAQGLINERDRREKEKFDRGLRECEDALALKDQDQDKDQDGVDGGEAVGEDGETTAFAFASPLGGRNRKGKGKIESSATKKKNAKLSAMLGAIKG